MRKSDASLITLASENGIRWTSAKLVEICNSALAESMRLVAVYSKSPIVKQLIGSNLYIDEITVTIASGTTIDIGSTVLTVLSVNCDDEIAGSTSNMYGYILPEFYIEYLRANKQPRSGERYFTIMYDATTNTRKIYLINKAGTTHTYTYLYRKSNYAVGGGELFIVGMDDLLLDIAERESRDREHNWERSAVLDKRIFAKLGVNLGG